MRFVAVGTLSLVMLLAAAGCGGGSGGGNLVDVVISSDAALDGFVLNNGTADANGNGPAVGDIDSALPGVGGRVFLSFPLVALPPGATIVRVTLETVQDVVIGTPYASHGVILLDHLDYGATLDAGDFALPSLVPAVAILSTDPALGRRQADVTLYVQADRTAGRTRSQFRLRFSMLDTDDDGVADVTRWTDGELSGGGAAGTEPRLLVTYAP